ncbi:hypothetical protein AB0M46_10065 [Dactylosporangium sp. NPDC051485]|uniref:hypothetical protein n=1 Tax=Dactylosporangium sp. NPDC051485 TaxID=3154846 RepID=UPI003428A591
MKADRSIPAAVALAAGVGMLALDLAVQLQAHAGPWHVVALAPVERPSRAVLLFAAGLVLLAAATWRVLDGRTAARVLAVSAGVLALLALVAAAAANVFETGFDEDSPSYRVAVAADGRHALYARSVYGSGYETCYRLRTTGHLVRESRVDVACVTGVQVGFADDSHVRIGARTIAFSGVATAGTVYD